ncbi:S53 family peptidase [Kineococcus rhizosphaerae]|nr:S53 family peptidase [Kineococcus rhizosphaerae]
MAETAHPSPAEPSTGTARRSRIRLPRAASRPFASARDVARAYAYPIDRADGSGLSVGIVELGGAVGTDDLRTYLTERGLAVPDVTSVSVDGAQPASDGADGADGEVMLDVEVIAAVAPGAAQRVYFAPNTDAGFREAVSQAVADGVDVVSISWGGPENHWDAAAVTAFDAVLASARRAGVPVFVAAGDTGSQDSGGDGKDHVDFPASSPNAVGCGGTRLTVDASGARAAEVVWDDNDRSSATGGGTSVFFPGRNVPDVAGNADPVTGYTVRVDGQEAAIGGTSAVAPLYAALYLLTKQLTGRAWDPLTVVPAHPTVCFDVTSGDNGTFRAGPGRDATTGFGVVDGSRLLAVLGEGEPVAAQAADPVAAFWADERVRDWAQREHAGEDEHVAQAVLALVRSAGRLQP